jgi:hypothetical protein
MTTLPAETTLSHDPTTNGGPPLETPFDLIKQEIEDLYDEARNFADGEPIDSAEMHDAISALYDGLHESGKRADELRVAEKKPLDEKIDAIQALYNPLIQPKKGKVAIGKDVLSTLLAAWRKKVADAAAAKAAEARKEAEELAAAAQAAIRSSSGNLEAREAAEELLKEAKYADKFANRANKAATTGTGLRTVWVATITDEEAALEWAYTTDPAAFIDLVQSMADSKVRIGTRSIPGMLITETKVV